ncbi:methylthioribulose 1-phosphate dehydratase [Spirulina sp. CCNP1310]|uniref:methylthioribulose 1-phosphate dehydratase n=1 Tax=Spirulina sp. CCNP1310 TaxID=3110249 RepID=UPI002B1F0A32|nr:methylthioribulose 1-phosphate dehydratase [Spirulina sp. CCNP1310]MEA5419228.1 methylthioribulose 1-phosphate dehydratase [Spirulina sp. CCNP1310]
MDEQQQNQAFADLIQTFYHQGKAPATSTNYSWRNPAGEIIISRSGVDKAKFSPEDWMKVDLNGLPLPEYAHCKPSAETLIHCFLYAQFPDTKCILHSHSVAATVLSGLYCREGTNRERGEIVFQDYEVIKGIRGYHTHDCQLRLPIVANSQDMGELCDRLSIASLQNFGFLIARHGLYAWGDSLGEAKRHLDVWEFLLECELALLQIQHP